MTYAVIQEKNGFGDDLFVVPMRMMEKPETVEAEVRNSDGDLEEGWTATKAQVEVRCIISKELDALESVAALAAIAKKILKTVEAAAGEVAQ